MNIINFNLRIDEALNEKIIKLAEKEGRSKNKQIEYILKQYIDSYEENNSKLNITQTNNKGKNIVKIKDWYNE